MWLATFFPAKYGRARTKWTTMSRQAAWVSAERRWRLDREGDRAVRSGVEVAAAIMESENNLTKA